ncbi:hypothetical protein L211DRAFT_227309 [Terfezia boudieri ATCC MYA-4762]|uniref:Uncharacterized protein n=1 Tax=Terfezia boudieri ATCC MYA-4762 TaxID=1051890 RepID=A0A3N4LLV6_9PEZI|nr:hypothetical protein L211DRAFT_227309 [Terfezia boudieri ATCC MYA-4762]
MPANLGGNFDLFCSTGYLFHFNATKFWYNLGGYLNLYCLFFLHCFVNLTNLLGWLSDLFLFCGLFFYDYVVSEFHLVLSGFVTVWSVAHHMSPPPPHTHSQNRTYSLCKYINILLSTTRGGVGG